MSEDELLLDAEPSRVDKRRQPAKSRWWANLLYLLLCVLVVDVLVECALSLRPVARAPSETTRPSRQSAFQEIVAVEQASPHGRLPCLWRR